MLQVLLEVHTNVGNNRRKFQRTSDNIAISLNKNQRQSRQTRAMPIVQGADSFIASPRNQSKSSYAGANINNNNNHRHQQLLKQNQTGNQIPIPALPPIECTSKRGRLEPLTIEEYESKYRESGTDLELIERVFYGSMACNELRAALWPYLFGIVKFRGRFERVSRSQEGGEERFVFVEHEQNIGTWKELHNLYYVYQNQWKSVLPDQELRFSAFRERKSLIERDIIRCDRLHPFYAEQPHNLATLTNLLMTYMMYDFDIGYVQGMSDLAGPILYMYKGDLVKAFWIFVEVMKLFRRNFELTQKTIHFQLGYLFELIKYTDPIFAEYLEDHESSNCFFAFRAIFCQFKRELMKEDEDDYSNVLLLWDTIWCTKRRQQLLNEHCKTNKSNNLMQKSNNNNNNNDFMKVEQASAKVITCEQPQADESITISGSPFFHHHVPPLDLNQSNSPRHSLTETEIFVLSLCLSMIRRERDLVLANKLDGTDIHLHFIDPKLAIDLNGFIEHAINIYSYIKSDEFDLKRLTAANSRNDRQANIYNAHRDNLSAIASSPQGSLEGYDLLSDFLIINGASGS